MTYISWIENHSKKHQKLVQKLYSLSENELIEYFLYENMQKNEPYFCLLYKENKKCHDMKNLNCYLCACPEFRLQNDSDIKSYCFINSKFGSAYKAGNEIHQDCTKCLLPHRNKYIKKVFNKDWKLIMKDVFFNK